MRAWDLATQQPWAITEESLRLILSIAARENLTPEAVEAQLGRPLNNTHEVTTRDGVARIPITGPIFRYADFFTRISGATAVETLASDLGAALADPTVGAIVFDIDSPGGEITGIDELAELIHGARGQKPITAYVSGLGASAAYWLASAADRVVVSPASLVGSIGVVMAYLDTSEQDARRGVQRIEFVSSQSPDKRPDPKSDSGKATIQATVDGLAAVFVDAVSRYRGVEPSHVLSDFGRGGVLVGAEAVKAGLADSVGTFEEVQASLAAQVRAEAEEKRHMNLWEQLRAKLEGQPAAEEKEAPPAAAAQIAAQPAPLPLYLLQPGQASAAGQAMQPAVEESEQIKQLRAQVDRERQKRLETEAKAFAAEVRAADLCLPHEQPEIASAYMQALKDDEDHPATIALPDGKTGTRCDLIRRQYSARSPHGLKTEFLPGAALPEGARVLPTGGGGEKEAVEAAAASARAYAEKANRNGKKGS